MSEILTIKEAADYVGLSRQSIYLKIWAGEITPVRLLGKLGIPKAVLEKSNKLGSKVKKSNGKK